MSYDLVSLNDKRKTINVDLIIWIKLLDLSKMYGWVPIGTYIPSIDNSIPSNHMSMIWHGSYHTNEGQIVSTKDALALANGLKAALDDIPDHETVDKVIDLYKESDLSGFGYAKEIFETLINTYGECQSLNGNLHPFDLFSGSYKQEISRLIKFCHKGAFAIW